MNGYVAKPIRVPDLIEAIKNSWFQVHFAGDPTSVAMLEEPAAAAAPVKPSNAQVSEKPETDADGGRPALDPAALDRLRRVVDDNQEVMAMLIDSFLEDAPGLLDTMQRGIADRDAEAVRRAYA